MALYRVKLIEGITFPIEDDRGLDTLASELARTGHLLTNRPQIVSRNASFDGLIFAPGSSLNGLQFRPDGYQLTDSGESGFGNDRAPVLSQDQKPLVFEHLKRFADWHARHLELCGQLLLAKPGTGLVLTRDDAVADRIRHQVPQRTTILLVS